MFLIKYEIILYNNTVACRPVAGQQILNKLDYANRCWATQTHGYHTRMNAVV
jgi:hypothetical protein